MSPSDNFCRHSGIFGLLTTRGCGLTRRGRKCDRFIRPGSKRQPETKHDEPNITQIKDSTANPAPLGLLGFGMTTVLLNLHNAGFYELNSMILAMGICYGGVAQVIAGIMEWKKGNTFAATAFISYGFFWLSLVTLIVLPKLGLGAPSDETAMSAYLAIWGLFTAVMFLGTLRLNRALQFVFGSLTILFFLLAYRRLHRRRRRLQTFDRIRRHHLRFLRDLRGARPGAQ